MSRSSTMTPIATRSLRPMTGLRPRRNVADEDLAIRPQRRSSTTNVVPRGIIHIQYTRPPFGLRTSRAAERRWIRIPIPAARRRAYGGEISNLVHTPYKGSPLIGGRKEEERIYWMNQKGTPT